MNKQSEMWPQNGESVPFSETPISSSKVKNEAVETETVTAEIVDDGHTPETNSTPSSSDEVIEADIVQQKNTVQPPAKNNTKKRIVFEKIEPTPDTSVNADPRVYPLYIKKIKDRTNGDTISASMSENNSVWNDIHEFDKTIDKKAPSYKNSATENTPPAIESIPGIDIEEQKRKAYQHYKKHERLFRTDSVTGKVIEPTIASKPTEADLIERSPLEKREIRYKYAASFLDRFDWLRVQIEEAIENKNVNQAILAMNELKANDYLQLATDAYDEADAAYTREVAEDSQDTGVQHNAMSFETYPVNPTSEKEELHTIHESYKHISNNSDVPTGTFDSKPVARPPIKKSYKPRRGSGIPVPSQAMIQAAQEAEARRLAEQSNPKKKSYFGKAATWLRKSFWR